MQPEKVVTTGLLLAALIGTPLGAFGDPPAMVSAPSATSGRSRPGRVGPALLRRSAP